MYFPPSAKVSTTWPYRWDDNLLTCSALSLIGFNAIITMDIDVAFKQNCVTDHHGNSSVPAQIVEYVLEELGVVSDVPSDGYCDLDLQGLRELVAELRDMQQQRTDMLTRAFTECDVSGSGSLEEDEFIALLMTSDLDVDEPEARVIMAEADADHDGRVSLQDFLALADRRRAVIVARAERRQHVEQFVASLSSEEQTARAGAAEAEESARADLVQREPRERPVARQPATTAASAAPAADSAQTTPPKAAEPTPSPESQPSKDGCCIVA
jgi:Ca2+-binding EF-hand superfamily protein